MSSRPVSTGKFEASLHYVMRPCLQNRREEETNQKEIFKRKRTSGGLETGCSLINSVNVPEYPVWISSVTLSLKCSDRYFNGDGEELLTICFYI